MKIVLYARSCKFPFKAIVEKRIFRHHKVTKNWAFEEDILIAPVQLQLVLIFIISCITFQIMPTYTADLPIPTTEQMFAAVEANSLEQLQALLDVRGDVNAKRPEETLLHASLKTNIAPIIARTLIMHGAHIHVRDRDGETPLYRVARLATHLEIISLLIEQKADINETDAGERTPLFRAAASSNEAACSLLINSKADVNKSNGFTPLHTAAAQGHIPTIAVLLRSGASRRVKFSWHLEPEELYPDPIHYELTPEELARDCRHYDAAHFIKNWLSLDEYEQTWKPLQNTIFINQHIGLPELVFPKDYELTALLGGALFLQQDFEMLQKCILALGDTHFVVIQNEFGGRLRYPQLRMKFPANITWQEMMSGNFISVVLCQMVHNEYFVFGPTDRWGKYAASDYEDPADIIGFKPEYAPIFRKHLQQPEEDWIEVIKYLPPAYKKLIL